MRRARSLGGIWTCTPLSRVTLRADGTWEQDRTSLPPAREMRVPSHWEREGLESFFGTVRFEREFEAPRYGPGESVWLLFKGVDYFATVYVNGQEVGRHEGYFQAWDLEITKYLLPGDNRLVVEVTSPKEEPGTAWPERKRVIKGVLTHWDCRPGSWDPSTGQDMHSGGIWNDVVLEVRPAVFFRAIRLATRLTPANEDLNKEHGPGEVTVPPVSVARVTASIDLSLTAAEAELPDRVELAIGEHVASRSLTGWDRSSPVDLAVTIPEPRLWWTWDHGEPYLYSCTAALYLRDEVADQQELLVGLRQVDLDPSSGEWMLNGRRMFVRGTNVVPTLWLGEYDMATIQSDIQLLRAANVNAVRVCVHVNRHELYSALDEAGILVWQDFPLQWGYIQSDEFIAEATRQTRDMVRQFRNHTCIAVWCCQNESTSYNREVLDPLLAQAAREEDSSRYVRPTSEFSEHPYFGWYRGDLHDYKQAPRSAIITEFGAQALPAAYEMIEMFGEKWPPDWERLAYHDFQYHQTFHVAHVALGSSWDDFVSSSQEYQAKVLKAAIESMRRFRYRPVGGVFQFMFMDCWPSVTWSTVSYARRPKRGYYALQQAYQPVLVGADIEPGETWITYTDLGSHWRPIVIAPWLINDTWTTFADVTLYMRLVPESGDAIMLAQVNGVVLPGDSVVDLPSTRLSPPHWPSGPCRVEMALEYKGEVVSRNVYDVRLLTENPALAVPLAGKTGPTGQ